MVEGRRLVTGKYVLEVSGAVVTSRERSQNTSCSDPVRFGSKDKVKDVSGSRLSGFFHPLCEAQRGEGIQELAVRGTGSGRWNNTPFN